MARSKQPIDRQAAGEDALQAIKKFLEWGAKTGSDRDLFDDMFRKALDKAGIEFTEPDYQSIRKGG